MRVAGAECKVLNIQFWCSVTRAHSFTMDSFDEGTEKATGSEPSEPEDD